MFDRIVTSTNESRVYLEFWKIQLLAHKVFFPNKKLTVAFYTDRTENDELVQEMINSGLEVRIYNIVSGYSEANVAKILRYICASEYTNEVCVTVDIDTIPLQSKYLNDVTSKREVNKLLAIGAEVLIGTVDEGKFPAHHMCAEGHIFKKLYNSNDKSLEDLLLDLKGTKVFDNKEDICGHVFSDESLNRALIKLNNVPVQHTERKINIRTEWVDRSWWNLNVDKLNNGEYVEANLLRPYSSYLSEISPIENYLKKLLSQTT